MILSHHLVTYVAFYILNKAHAKLLRAILKTYVFYIDFSI